MQVSNTHSTVLVVIKLSGVKYVFVPQWEHFMYWIHISDWLLLHTENLDKQDINNTENLVAVFKYPDVGL